MALDVSTPSALAGTMTGINACIVNYVYRILLASIPVAVIVGIFSRYLQIEREKRQSQMSIGEDVLITAVMSFVLVLALRLVFVTWEYYGVPVGCIYANLGFNSESCSGGSSNPNSTMFLNADPSALGIQVCPAEPFVKDLAYALSLIVTISKLMLFAVPIFILLSVAYKSAEKIGVEVKEMRESQQMAAIKFLATNLFAGIAITMTVQSVYGMMYVDYNTILKWAANFVLAPFSSSS